MTLEIYKSTADQLRPNQSDINKRFGKLEKSEKKLKKLQQKLSKTLAELQSKIQAENKQAVLIIFQAMDAAGKDSTIRNVFRECDIAGVDSVSFKQPSKVESSHDFIWRCHKQTPARGQIKLFNRSYYEEVLVVKVHPEWLASQGIQTPVNESFWENRYTGIIEFENHLKDSGTKIIKFMLDVSQEEQHKRLIRRYTTPSKQWKFSIGDIKESKRWSDYQSAFDSLLVRTSTSDNPWHVIPADDKILMRLLVTEILINEFQKLNPQYPAIPTFSEKDLILIEELTSGKI
jgi:PPK2 family polyphosphate:nucleotide phosphotransferase